MGQSKATPIDDPAGNNPPAAKAAATSTKGKGKPKLKKKVADDPFGSDHDDHEDGTIQDTKQNVPSKNSSAKSKRSNYDEDEEEVRPKKKRMT